MKSKKLLRAFALGPITCLILFGFPKECCPPVKTLIFAALIYPILEELVFRGCIQSYMLSFTSEKVFMELSLANFFTSLLFSAVHFMYIGWETAIMVFLPSLIFGYFRESKNNLKVPIGLHCFYNLNFIIFNTMS